MHPPILTGNATRRGAVVLEDVSHRHSQNPAITTRSGSGTLCGEHRSVLEIRQSKFWPLNHLLRPPTLFIFHVNDCEDRPAAQLQDAHRLLPGSGILQIKRMADELKATGYDRLASIELFRPE